MDGDYLMPGTKRGSDELMSHNSPMVTANGTGLSPHHTGNDMNNDAKKVKLDQNAPSRVVHIRSLPPDVTEADIVQLGIPFGKMTNVLLLKQKNQAFLEFQDESAASTMVSYHTTTPAQIRLKQVYVQFSNHKELKTDQTHSFQNATAQAALQAAQAVMVGGTGTEETRTKTTLRVIVENLVYPVTIEVLYQIFCKFGKVLKMIIFTKNNTFQALIQFGDSVSANAAKLSLDGQNIYNGCCTLRIDYSKLSNLNVKYNNDKSRDFTNPNLPSGDPALDQAMQYGDRRLVAEDMCADRFEGIYRNQQEILFGTRRKNPAGAPGVVASPFATMAGLGMGMGPTPLTAIGATTLGVQGGYSGIADRSNIENITPPSTQRQEYYTQQKDILLASGKRKIIAPPMPMTQFGMHNAAALNVARMGMPMAPQAGSCVLLVSNLDEQKITPDALFTLFGVYGDVHRVKILFNKKDNALVQMAEPHQAQLAIAHLDKVKVWGKQIRVTQSKHAVVQMPKDGQPDAGLTKDFTNSSLHRFKRPGSKNCQNIFPPSSVLHLSNIPPSITEEELEQAFTPHGSVTGFKFFPKDRKMALIQMGSPEEAITALIAMHNYPLSDSNHLRVSFSKSTI